MVAKARQIIIAELNISMHSPHSAKGYAELFREIFRSRTIVRLGNLHGAMLGSLYGASTNPLPLLLTGEVYRFVNIDPTNPWFNTQTQKVATEDEVEDVNIPPHLRAHLQRIPFSFNLKTHRLHFIAKDRGNNLGVGPAVKIFQKLVERFVSDGKFPMVNITAVPEITSVDAIFSMHKLETLVIDLVRPNSDDADDEEARFLKKLEREQSRMRRTTLFHENGKSLKPDSETKTLANVAALNGKVVGFGKDSAGDRIEESTVNRPALTPARVNEDIETTMDVLNRHAT